jgi:hypothetical protein
MPALLPASIREKGEIFQDTAKIGSNYTGIGGITAGFSLNPRKLRYGFILIPHGALTDPSKWAQVVLPYAPEAISQDEPAATAITFTQNSGKYIERRGQITKAITISGTTGFEPHPKTGALVRSFLSSGTIAAQEGPNTGYADFLKLRNLFRSYQAVFSDDTYKDQRDDTFFVWVNEKDDEQWVVEPTNFRMSRQTPKNKFTYHYEISFTTIAPLDNVQLSRDPLTLFQKIANVLRIISEIAETIMSAIEGFTQLMAFAAGALKEAADLVANVANRVAQSLNALAQGFRSLLDVRELIAGPASLLSTTQASFQAALENFESVGEELAKPGGQIGFDPIPTEARQSLYTVAENMALLSGRLELYQQTFSGEDGSWAQATRYTDPSYGFGGYNTNLTAPLVMEGVQEGTILPGQDIQGVAQMLLGSSERFMELVVLNNLKPPYISPSQEERAQNTLAPGDPILYPASGTPDGSRTSVKTTVFADPTFTGRVLVGGSTVCQLEVYGTQWRDNQWQGFTVTITEGPGAGEERKILANTADTIVVSSASPWTVTPTTSSVMRLFLRRLGVAPRKSSQSQVMGTDLKFKDGDFVVTNKGDLAVLDGIDNAIQAVEARLQTRPGDVPVHADYGLCWEPGQRANSDSVFSYSVAVRRALLADPRIEAVERLDVTINKDVLSMQGYVVLTGRPQAFAVDTRGAGGINV